MTVDERKRRIILQLKEVKVAHGLTVANIADLMDSDGHSMSESTLKAVFAKGSEENPCFKYETTLLPIQRAMLKTYGEDSDIKDIKALKEFIRNKNETIELLFAEVEKLERDNEFLKAEALRKEQIIDRKDALLAKLIDKLIDK